MIPLVSVGMPVYNGARFLREALDSLLSQDYPRFEIVICDNASDDGTEAICREYEAREPRLRYSRNPENLGAVYNFNLVFERSNGEFFMWAACDDLWASTYIRKCAELLLAHPDASLCHVQSRQMTTDGRPFGEPYRGFVNTDPDPRVRWRRVLSNLGWHMAIYGMMRVSCLRRSGLIREGWGSDQLLVAEMALYGTIVQVPEQLWWHRRPETLTADDAYRLVMQKMQPPGRAAAPRRWTQLAIHREYVRIALAAQLEPRLRRRLVWDAVHNYVSSAAWANDLEEMGVPLHPLRRLKRALQGAARPAAKDWVPSTESHAGTKS